jgi:hypothetical protein
MNLLWDARRRLNALRDAFASPRFFTVGSIDDGARVARVRARHSHAATRQWGRCCVLDRQRRDRERSRNMRTKFFTKCISRRDRAVDHQHANRPMASRAMKFRAAMIGTMGPMALLLVTLTAVAKASGSGSTSSALLTAASTRPTAHRAGRQARRSTLLHHLWTSRSSSSHPKAG